MPVGACDAYTTGLERLTQCFECGAIELRQLIEKQDPMMGERYLSGAGPLSPAYECYQ